MLVWKIKIKGLELKIRKLLDCFLEMRYCYFVDYKNDVATIKCSVRGKMGVIIKELVEGDVLYVSGKILAVDGDKTVVKNLKIEKSGV